MTPGRGPARTQVADRLGRPAATSRPPAGSGVRPASRASRRPAQAGPVERAPSPAPAPPRRPPASAAATAGRRRAPRRRGGRRRRARTGRRRRPGRSSAAGGDDVDVAAAASSRGDRPAERRPADDEHPVRPVRGREPAEQQQVAAGQHARPGRQPRARLGHDRPAAGLGQRDRRRGRRGRRVAEHHDRPGRQVVGDRPGGAGGTTAVHGRPPGRPASGSGQSPSSGRPGTSGSRRRQVQVHRPGPAVHERAAATARQTAERQYAFCPARVSGARRARRTAAPRRRTARAGRWSGSRRPRAAPAAGPRSAPAAARRRGRPPAPPGAGSPPRCPTWSPPAPAARTPSPARARGTRPTARRCARAAAAGRPRRRRAARTPAARTRAGREHRLAHPAADQLVDEHPGQRGRRVHGAVRPAGRGSAAAGPPPGPPVRRRGQRGQQVRVRADRPHRQPPPSGTSGAAVTSAAISPTVASPQAYGSSGSAAASATPAAIPTDVSSALETTTGSPHLLGDPQRRPGPRPAARP